jgi:hypothetical protein
VGSDAIREITVPPWVLVVLVIVGLIAVVAINNRIFAWCRENYPWMTAPKVVLSILVLCLAVIAFGLWINPPSKVREDFQRAHPELFLSPNQR